MTTSNDDGNERLDIGALRAELFDTLRRVKAGTIDLANARVVNEIGKTLVDTARVEVDFVRATDGVASSFLQTAADKAGKPDTLPPGITGRMVHRIGG